MTLLSDTSILKALASGKLVKSGDPAKVSQCAYHFTAGKIFTGGSGCKAIDWTSSNPHSAFELEPGAIVWVRMRDEVSLPDDICATWWQTNTLSRKGIMLANMSIVDPGYEGPLACLFVNFGKAKVLIDDHTIVAKLLFYKIDEPVATPFKSRLSTHEYDLELHNIAINGASSFP